MLTTQGDRSCHRISQDLAWKMRESHRILQGNTGNIWNMEAVFPPGIFRIFFPMISGRILLGSTRICRNPPKKIQKIPRPEYCFQLHSIFRCIPAVSRRASFTWGSLIVECVCGGVCDLKQLFSVYF